MIGGEELKMKPKKMEVIMRHIMPTNVYDISSFVVRTQNLRKFITSFSTMVTPFYPMRGSG